MDNLEIFDKDGKELHIADVIARFLKQQSLELQKPSNSIKIGIEFAQILKQERLYITSTNGNRLDSFELNEL
ncbi:MAG: hypothetical protein MK076_00880 [Flavobacteriales bacterium]|nr:hypothetical protein [Flavobacteriales bacterium]